MSNLRIEFKYYKGLFPIELARRYNTSYFQENEIRKKNGLLTILNVSWEKKPYLDGVYNSVYYAVNVDWSNNTSSTEGTAIILGREGYTEEETVKDKRLYNNDKL